MDEVVCQLCHTRVKHSALEFHLNTQHFKVKPYRCHSCNFRAPTSDLIEIHQSQSGHKRTETVKSPSKSYLSSLPKWIDSTPIQPEVVRVVQHSTPTQKVAKRMRSVVEKRHKSGGFECLECGKTYAQLQSRQFHSYTHGNTKFPCGDCGKIYTQPKSLKNHQRSAHSTQTRSIHRCSECEKTFEFESHLRQHSFVHLNTKFPCEICAAKYSNPTGLQRHLNRIHPTGRHSEVEKCRRETKFSRKS